MKWIWDRVPRNVLLLLNNWKSPLTIVELSKLSNSQYSSVLKAIKKLEESGFVKTEKRGRVRIVWLTDFGKKVSNLFKRIDKMVRNNG